MDELDTTLAWFEKAIPTPNQKNIQTQTGVHLEEVAEFIETLRGKDRLTQSMLTAAMVAIHSLALHLKNSKGVSLYVKEEDRVNTLDAICDQIVTCTGTAHMLGFKILGAMEEVNKSNYSKFENGEPVFDKNMKVGKGPHYQPPDLTKFV